MKPKPLAISVVVLALLAAIAWYLQRPPAAPPPDPRVGHPVLADATLGRADQVRLTDQGKTVLLKKSAGGKWVDASYYDLPVDFSKLSQFTDGLVKAKVRRLVSRRAPVLARLGFKGTTVTLLGGGGKPLWKLTFGKEADSGGRFIKYDDEAKAYLADLTSYIDSDPKNWADSTLVNLKSADVASIDIGFAPGKSVTVSRTKKGADWESSGTPAGQRVKASAVSDLLSSLTSLRFKNTTAPDDPAVKAARAHSRTVTITTFDHRTLTIGLGRKPAEKVPAPVPAKPKPKTGKSASKTKSKAPPKKPKEKTIPAGPVYAFVHSSNAKAPVNALMKKRAFQVFSWNFTSLPKKPTDLFEPVPKPPAAKAAKATSSAKAGKAASPKAKATAKPMATSSGKAKTAPQPAKS